MMQPLAAISLVGANELAGCTSDAKLMIQNFDYDQLCSRCQPLQSLSDWLLRE